MQIVLAKVRFFITKDMYYLLVKLEGPIGTDTYESL